MLTLVPTVVGQAPAPVDGEAEELEGSRTLWVNDPPAVQLTGTRTTATVGETLTFTPVVTDADPLARYAYYLSRAGQPDVLLAQGLLSGGAQPPAQNYTFNTEGTYTVTLFVQDRWGAWGDGAASVTVAAPPAGLTARFTVEQLVRDANGTLTWQSVPAGTVVEQGLRLRFNASASGPGAAYYVFEFGDGTGNADVTAPTALHAYGAPGTYTVNLTVYDAGGYESASTVGTVSVGNGLVYVGRSLVANGGSMLLPSACSTDATDAWVLTTDGRLLMIPYTDPTFPVLGQVVADNLCGAPVPCPVSMGGNRYLLVSNGTLLVRVYRVNGMALTLLGSFNVPQDASSGVTALAAVGNRLFIGKGASGRLYEYDLGSVISSPATAQPVRSWGSDEISGGPVRFAVSGNRLFSGGQTSTLTVLTCPTGSGAPVRSTVTLPGSGGAIRELCATSEFVIARQYQTLTFVSVNTLAVLGQCASAGVRMAAGSGRLYELTGAPMCRVVKRDCTNPAAVYDMQVRELFHSFEGFAFCATVMYQGAPRPLLYLGDANGPLLSYLTRP